MANPTAALNRVRDAGADLNAVQTFQRYEPDYEAILTVVDDYGNEVLLEEVTEWLIEMTRDEGEFPAPDTVRDRARTLSIGNGIIVPANSPLRD